MVLGAGQPGFKVPYFYGRGFNKKKTLQERGELFLQREGEANAYQQFHVPELKRIEAEAARCAEDQKNQLKTMANEFEHHTLEYALKYKTR